MRFWLLTLCLLVLLPAAADSNGVGVGVKSEVLVGAIDSDIFLNITPADTDAEPESGDGILTPFSILPTDYIPPIHARLRTRPVLKRYASFEIRGPPIIS